MNVIHPPIDFHIGLRLCPVVYIPPFKSFIRHKPQPAKRVNTENTEPVVKTLNYPERLSAIVILLKNLNRVESADYQITARCQEYISDICRSSNRNSLEVILVGVATDSVDRAAPNVAVIIDRKGFYLIVTKAGRIVCMVPAMIVIAVVAVYTPVCGDSDASLTILDESVDPIV